MNARRRGGKPTIVITGSSGLLGRALINKLAVNYDIVGLDFVLPPEPAASFEAVRVDLTSDRSVDAALERVRAARGRRVASVIHLAGYYDLSGEPNDKYETVTVRGTERLLHALRSFTVDQFIFASTMLVHAPKPPGQRINEESAVAPKTPYPQSKIETERLLVEKHGDTPIAILRLAGVYDERCHAVFLAQQIVNIFEHQFESYVYPGDPGTGQPYLHIEDLTDVVARLIERRDMLPPELTLLVGEPETLSYDDLQRRVGCLLHGEEWETRQIPKALAKAGQWLQEDVLDQDPFVQPWMIDQASDHYELDISRIREVLEWQPRHRLGDTLPEMLAALKTDPPGWYRANKLNAARVAAANIEQTQEEADVAAVRRRDEAVRAALSRQHGETLWAPLANFALGLWLVFSPAAFGLFDGIADSAIEPPPSAGYALPPPAIRDALLGWSDIVSGALVMLFAGLSLSRAMAWTRWALPAIGLWLLFAPLIFWTTSAAAFTNDAIVGALIVAFAVLALTPPGIASEALADGTDTPRGWTYSPSSYVQRVPIAGLALIGFLVARYMTAYQLGHLGAVWDPLFADGTRRVITSSVSHAWPIADAGVGAMTYLLEVLSGLVGDRRRWRTMPWLVFAFGLLIVPLGAVSIAFIIIQPIMIGTWCSLCLVTAVVTVLMIPYSLDELIATVQFLLRSRRAGKPVWRTFWRGGTEPGGGTDKASSLDAPLAAVLRNFLTGGVTFPWTLLVSVALGIALMSTRLLFGTADAMADSDHLVGCLVITVAVTALAEVARPVRLLNLPLGAWLIAAPFILEGAATGGIVASIALGTALILLSLPRGTLSHEHYGGWDRFIV